MNILVDGAAISFLLVAPFAVGSVLRLLGGSATGDDLPFLFLPFDAASDSKSSTVVREVEHVPWRFGAPTTATPSTAAPTTAAPAAAASTAGSARQPVGAVAGRA